ncbi:MAG TPA: EcsC family protein [Blastocatellia bacterium]|nr:EcsC family protein [Blastocatellia bacterium]
MNSLERSDALAPQDREDLTRAVWLLERPSFAARVAEFAGRPVGQFLDSLPKFATERVRNAVTAAMLKSLKVALTTLDDDSSAQPSSWMPKLLAGATGGLGGMFGLATLALELPVTTTLMLRTIAGIARSEGEDLSRARPKLACLEVFALGGRAPESGSDAGYYAARAMLTQAVNEAASYLFERGVADQTAPVMVRLLDAIGSRFGVVVSEKAAAEAVPLIGAIGGATINVVFMDHFQKVAQGHFIVRRLERKYGRARIRSLYGGSAARLAAGASSLAIG